MIAFDDYVELPRWAVKDHVWVVSEHVKLARNLHKTTSIAVEMINIGWHPQENTILVTI